MVVALGLLLASLQELRVLNSSQHQILVIYLNLTVQIHQPLEVLLLHGPNQNGTASRSYGHAAAQEQAKQEHHLQTNLYEASLS